MSSVFFDSNIYFIDKNINYFKYGNCFRIFNEKGNHVGYISEEISKTQKFLTNFLNKNILPFQLDIKDNKGNLHSSTFKGWTFMLSTTLINDNNGNTIGFIKQKFKLLNPVFTIYNKNKQPIADIIGKSDTNYFQIYDPTGKKIGSINKKWTGDMYGFFSTANKFNITLKSDDLELLNRSTILLGALIVDKILL
tara:strand:- start:2649 stop:3230 length:582 start_codon:yes stop_codon:yes gene_type:complete